MGELIIAGMRIRTLLGPPLPHEIVRDTATAIVLSTTYEKPAGALAEPMPRPAPCTARPQHERDSRAR